MPSLPAGSYTTLGLASSGGLGAGAGPGTCLTTCLCRQQEDALGGPGLQASDTWTEKGAEAGEWLGRWSTEEDRLGV